MHVEPSSQLRYKAQKYISALNKRVWTSATPQAFAGTGELSFPLRERPALCAEQDRTSEDQPLIDFEEAFWNNEP